MTNEFENTLYPLYKGYYNALRTFKIEGNTQMSFPYKLTDLTSKLKTINDVISDIEKRMDENATALIEDTAYLSEFYESVNEFNITKTGVEDIVNKVPERISERINKTEKGIAILQTRQLDGNQLNKLNTIQSDIKNAKDYLTDNNIVDAFKTSAKAYYDMLRLLSGTTPTDSPPGPKDDITIWVLVASLVLVIAMSFI